MQIPRSFARFSLVIASGLAILMACDSPSKPEPTTPEVEGSLIVRGVVEFPDALGFPDSGVWFTTNFLSIDSGRGSIDCSLKDSGKYDCSQSFEIDGVLGSDSLIQDMYALGLRIGRVIYTQKGAALLLKTDSAAIQRNLWEWDLLRAFLADFQKTSDGLRKPTRKDLAAYYAKRLLNGDTLALDNDLPKGMQIDSLKSALVLVASQQGLTAKNLADKKLLGLTQETIRTLTGHLVNAGVAIDTASFYPLAPVRVAQSIIVASDVVAGGGPVSLTGAFEWNTKWPVRKITALVKTSKGLDDSVVVAYKQPFDSTSGSFVLTGNATLTAKQGAQVGTDTLIITVVGDSGSAIGRAIFRVVPVPRDSSDLNLFIASPSRDTTVPHTTEKLLVVAQASSTSGVAEVAIGNTRLTKAPYLATIDLAVGFNLVIVRAVDTQGNISIDSVLVMRQKSASDSDTIPPTIRLKTPASDSTVPSSLDSIRLEWLVTDNSDALIVSLDDSVVNGDSGIYRRTVALRNGSNLFTIKARDAQDNQAIRTVVVTRQVDSSRPSILGPTDQTVAPQDSTFELVWKITKVKQVAKISFDSKNVPVDTIVIREVGLKVGANAFTLVVIDTAGQIYTETVVITRPAEILLPSVKTLYDSTVGAGTDSLALIWTIINSAKAKSAAVNGAAVAVGPSISKTVGLQPGSNKFTLELKDAAGTIVSSSVTITRVIETAILGVSMPSDRSVDPETENDTLVWMVYNPDKAVSGMLNGKPVTVGATVRQVVSLVVGNNFFVLVLKDATGNMVADTVVVVRAADTKGPDIVWIAPTSNKTVEATVTSFEAQVDVTDLSGVDSVHLNGELLKKADGDKYSGTISLPKPDGNPVKVLVVAKDAKGNISRDSLTITRKVPDNTDKPTIKLLKPSSATGNKLAFEETMLHVEADITDELLAVDAKSVTIGGVATKVTGSVYAADVPVLLTGKPVTLTIKASNVNGTTSTFDIEVTRAMDGLKPMIAADATTKTQTVEYRTKTITLSWKVSDNVGVAKLIFNGQDQQVTATVSKPLNLAVGDNKAVLVAIDTAGNKDSSVVVITRKADVTLPVLAITSPSQDTTVAFGTTSLGITATATDAESGIKALTLNGKDIKATGKTTVTLTVGKNAILIVATDSADNITTATRNVTVQTIVATPVFNPGGRTFTSMQKVAITSATNNAAIHYTTDGSTPTDKSTKYVGLIDVESSKTIKAIAILAGSTNSVVATEIYAINYLPAPAPTFTPGANTFAVAQKVSITTATKNAKIYYTTSGKDPTPDSIEYKTPINVDKSLTLKVLIVAPGFANSAIASAEYVIKYPAAIPTFSPDGAAALAGSQDVTITSATENTTICYTIGKDPGAPSATATGSTKCAPSGVKINVSLDTTIRAIAVGANYTNSAEATAKFKVKHDTSLTSITVDGVLRDVTGATVDWLVAGLNTAATVSALSKSSSATVRIGTPPTTTPISLSAASTPVQIVVTNGPSSMTYTLNLIKADTATLLDGTQAYSVVKLGDLWWQTENLNWGAGANAGTDGRKYTWAEATAGRDSKTVCPVDWRLPTAPEWSALTPDQVGKLDASAGAASFWTSTAVADDETQALVGQIETGKVTSTTPMAKSETEWIRCVK